MRQNDHGAVAMQCFDYRGCPFANNQCSTRTIEISERRWIARRLTRDYCQPIYPVRKGSAIRLVAMAVNQKSVALRRRRWRPEYASVNQGQAQDTRFQAGRSELLREVEKIIARSVGFEAGAKKIRFI